MDLIEASRSNNIDIVRELLDRGANPNIQNMFSDTAYTSSRDSDIRDILRHHIAKYGKSIYQTRDRSREYMSSVYSDIGILV